MESIYKELPKTVVIYARRNCTVEKCNTEIINQIKRCKDHAKEKNLIMAKVFVESNTDNEELYTIGTTKILDSAILFSIRHSIDYFLVDRPSSISSDTNTYLEKKGDLESNNISVLFANYDSSIHDRSYDNFVSIENAKFAKEQVIRKMTLESIKGKNKKLKGGM